MGTKLIVRACESLDLYPNFHCYFNSIRTDACTALALIYWHRFCVVRSRRCANIDSPTGDSKHQTTPLQDRTLLEQIPEGCVQAACIHLACKSSEAHRKLRDIINVLHALSHDGRHMSITSTYWESKDSIARTELLLLRVLRFHVHSPSAFPFITRLIKMHFIPYFALDSDEGTKCLDTVGRGVAQLSWAILMDAYTCEMLDIADEVCVRASQRSVAAAAMVVACRILNMGLPMPFGQWAELCSDTDADGLTRLCITLSRIYTKNL